MSVFQKIHIYLSRPVIIKMWIGQPHGRDEHTATISSPFVERAPNGRGLFSFVNGVDFCFFMIVVLYNRYRFVFCLV